MEMLQMSDLVIYENERNHHKMVQTTRKAKVSDILSLIGSNLSEVGVYGWTINMQPMGWLNKASQELDTGTSLEVIFRQPGG